MAYYDTPEEVADRLKDLTLTVNREMKGTLTPDHTRYLVTLEEPYRKPFQTAFESNPAVHGKPTVTQVFSALVTDAMTAADYSVSEFLDTFCAGDGMKPSAALAAYRSCEETRNWLRDELFLDTYDLGKLGATLDEHEEEVNALVEKVASERAAKRAHDHPKAPEGFVTVKELKDQLDIGAVASDHLDDFDGDLTDSFTDAADAAVDIMNRNLIEWLPGNEGWLEEAAANGLLDGVKGDIYKMIQAAQYECFLAELYEHREDICRWGTLDQLESAGVYAIETSLADDIMNDLDYDGDYTATDEAKEAIVSAVYAEFEERYGTEFAERAEECIADADNPNPAAFMNPCAMGIETVRAVNEKGYEAVFTEFWKEQIEMDGSEPADWGIDLDGTSPAEVKPEAPDESVSVAGEAKDMLPACDRLAGNGKAADAPDLDAPDAPSACDDGR